MKLDAIPLSELREMDERISKQIVIQEKREREAAIEQIYSIANSMGMPLSALMQSKSMRKITKPATEYVDPANPENVWRGRGKRPTWLKDALAAGKTLDQFRR